MTNRQSFLCSAPKIFWTHVFGSVLVKTKIRTLLQNIPHSYQTLVTQSQSVVFAITETVSNLVLNQRTACQIVRPISNFSLKLFVQFCKYFHSIVLCTVVSEHYKKNGVRFFDQVTLVPVACRDILQGALFL